MAPVKSNSNAQENWFVLARAFSNASSPQRTIDRIELCCSSKAIFVARRWYANASRLRVGVHNIFRISSIACRAR